MLGATYFATQERVTLYAQPTNKVATDTLLKGEEAGVGTGKVISNTSGIWIELSRLGLKEFFYGRSTDIAMNGDTDFSDDSILLAEYTVKPQKKSVNWGKIALLAIGGLFVIVIITVLTSD